MVAVREFLNIWNIPTSKVFLTVKFYVSLNLFLKDLIPLISSALSLKCGIKTNLRHRNLTDVTELCFLAHNNLITSGNED